MVNKRTMIYTDASLITPALTAMLQKKEEIEFIEKPLKSAYRRSILGYLGLAFALILVLDGYLWDAGMLIKDTWYMTLAVIFFWNIPTLFLLGGAFRVYKRREKAFYAYTNMRVIYTTLNSTERIDFVYFKDIHHIDVKDKLVRIDVNDMIEHNKKMRHIHGVRDPQKFSQIINTKLEPFRLGHG